MWSNRAEAERQDSALPTFESVSAAQRELFTIRDRSLGWLDMFARKRGVALPPEPEALETLEDLYFKLFVDDAGLFVRRHRSAFESAMGFFFGAVAVNNGATWTVYESPFVPRHFGLAVERGLVTVILNKRCENWARRPDNKRRRLLRREYERFLGSR